MKQMFGHQVVLGLVSSGPAASDNKKISQTITSVEKAGNCRSILMNPPTSSNQFCFQFGVPLSVVLGRPQEALIPNIVKDMIHYLCLCCMCHFPVFFLKNPSAEVRSLFLVRPCKRILGAAYTRANQCSFTNQNHN